MTQHGEQFRVVGDIAATGIMVGVLVQWLTAISLLLTIGWWIIRYWEKASGKQLQDVTWIKKLFRRE